MTSMQSLRIIDFFKIHHTLNHTNVNEFLVIVDDVVESKVKELKDETVSKTEFIYLNKDLQMLQKELRSEIVSLKLEIEKSVNRVESNLKSELNKHLIWIFSALIGIATLTLAFAKFFF